MRGILVFLVLGISACNKSLKFHLEDESQSFGQSVSYNNKVDLVWVVDNSSSMQQHQERLSNQVDLVMDSLDNAKMDYHVGVISTSMGGANPNGGKLLGEPNYIARKTAKGRKLLKDRFIIGQDGSDLERSFDSLLEALSPRALQWDHPEFLRDDALLVVVFLTDEDDHSVTIDAKGMEDYLDTLKRPFADGSRSWIANFIGVNSLTGDCRRQNPRAEPGLRYLELVGASNGVTESVCTADLRSALTNIKKRIENIMTDFHLDRKPVIESIRVFVDGVALSMDKDNGWTYEESGNLIRFHGVAVPSAESKIQIDFKPRETKGV